VTVSVCKLDPTFGEQIRYLVTKFDILVFLAIASLIMKKSWLCCWHFPLP